MSICSANKHNLMSLVFSWQVRYITCRTIIAESNYLEQQITKYCMINLVLMTAIQTEWYR